MRFGTADFLLVGVHFIYTFSDKQAKILWFAPRPPKGRGARVAEGGTLRGSVQAVATK